MSLRLRQFGFAFAFAFAATASKASVTLIKRLCLFRVCDNIADATNPNDYVRELSLHFVVKLFVTTAWGPRWPPRWPSWWPRWPRWPFFVGGQDGSTYSARHPTFHFSPWANYLTYCHLVEGSWLGTQVSMAGYHLLAACPSCPNTYHASQ